MILNKNDRKEIKKIIIESQKIGNETLKRKRDETEENNKKVKKVRKSKLSSTEMGAKGFINKDLLDQIKVLTKGNETITKKIIIEIQMHFAKYVEIMHKAFWKRHYDRLQAEGIGNNAIIKDIRDTG